MKKLFTILSLAVVSLFLFNGLLKAAAEGNNIVISGNVFYTNTTAPVNNAVVKLYFVNPDQITYKVLETTVVNERGEYTFVSSQLNSDDKVRIGAYVNDIVNNDGIIIGNNPLQTDELAELGAYANDLTMDCGSPLSEIYSKTSSVDLTAVSFSRVNLYIDKTEQYVTDDLGGGIGTYPREPILNQNYPNPFNPTTTIQFGIPQQAFVSLKVYDMSGKLVAELVNEIKEKGYYTVKFDGMNLSSGFYVYRLTAGDFTSIKKMSLIK